MSMKKVINTGSFRDPSGFVFSENGQIFRQVNPCYFDNYNTLVKNNIYDNLITKNLLISHKEIKHSPSAIILEAQKVPFISYPYEWSFSQLKDAALLTLTIEKEVLEKNFSLKDASAYNVQFIGSHPIFIDTLSFEPYEEGPWVAFGQFCKHFLYPLMLMSKVDLCMNTLLKNWIDGIPGDIAAKLMPSIRKCFSLTYWLYVKIPNMAQKKYEINKQKIKKTLSKNQLLKIIDALYLTIKNLKPYSKKTVWGDYYTFTNYTENSFDRKAKIVSDFIDKVSPKTLWDLGANNGYFSRLASNKGIQTIAFDIDPVAVEKNYLAAKEKREDKILPLLMDLTNPSSGIGWANSEREGFADRGPADCGLILALIHHLAIGNNIPFEAMSKYFSHLFNFIIIEYIPKEDSKVQELLRNRKDVFDTYSQENFEKAFMQFFEIEEKTLINDSLRYLYLMKRKA